MSMLPSDFDVTLIKCCLLFNFFWSCLDFVLGSRGNKKSCGVKYQYQKRQDLQIIISIPAIRSPIYSVEKR